MKRGFLSLATVLCSLLISATAMAQPPKQNVPGGSAVRSSVGLGARLTPDGLGFTGKFFVGNNVAIEAQLNGGGLLMNLDGPSFNVVGLVEYHIVLPDPSWRIYFGGGLHTGVQDRDWYYSKRLDDWTSGPAPLFGLDGVAGVEYAFKKIPLGLSADFKPAINFVPEVEFFAHNFFGVAARFYMGR